MVCCWIDPIIGWICNSNKYSVTEWFVEWDWIHCYAIFNSVTICFYCYPVYDYHFCRLGDGCDHNLTLSVDCITPSDRNLWRILFDIMLLYLPMIVTALPSLYLIKMTWILCCIFIAITNGLWWCWITSYHTRYDSLWISCDMEQSCYCLTRFYGERKTEYSYPCFPLNHFLFCLIWIIKSFESLVIRFQCLFKKDWFGLF